MIPLNPKLKMVLGIIVIGLIASGNALLHAMQASPDVIGPVTWLSPLLGMLVYVEGFLTTPPKAVAQLAEHKEALARLASKAGLVLAMLLPAGGVAVGGLLLTGCPQGAGAVGPAMSCVSAVVADALLGLNIDQILAKEKGPCVADAEEIVTILLGSQEPGVQATSAFKAAVVHRAAHPLPSRQ